MAKLYSTFGTSPISSFFNELCSNAFSDDFNQIQPDPFDFSDELPSIYSDIQKIESDPFLSYSGGSSPMDFDLDIKSEIRNTDLMWCTSDSTNALSTSASSMCSDISTGVPLAAVMGVPTTHHLINIKTEKNIENQQPQQQQQQQQHHQNPQRPPPTMVTARKAQLVTFKQETTKVADIKQEPTDDVEQQLAHHSIPNNKTTLNKINGCTTTTTTTMQNIPPGTSLLRKSQQQQQKKSSQQQQQQQQLRGTIPITKRGDQLLPSANTINNTDSSVNNCDDASSLLSNTIYQRPDTPHSLDDDSSPPMLSHDVDLRACVMGSNNISLPDDREDFISNVSQELQDMSKQHIDTRLISTSTLDDVIDVISNSSQESSVTLKSNSVTSTHSSSGVYSYTRCSEFDSDEESTMGSSNSSLLDHDIRYGAGGVSPVSSQSSNISSSNTQHYIQHRDHSYTRCKDGMDDLSTNLDTPSDSEEEIDVVSINDKKLPTNPSDKDRRALQTKVAHKFNAARIVKNPNGIRTIPARRGSYELPYTPASSSPVKSVNNSRFPSPAATPYQNQYTTKYVQQQQQQMMTVVVTDSATGLPVNIVSTPSAAADKSRKRLIGNIINGGSSNLIAASELSTSLNSVVSMPPTKKHRGKKTKHLVTAVQLSNGVLKRHYSVDETADTIEKRNLHNDMERQRRIGLKNLFEALKKQIPSIKDKERAPKVNILREAAKLCEALTREDQQLLEQKAKLKDELRRNQEILAQLKAANQQAD